MISKDTLLIKEGEIERYSYFVFDGMLRFWLLPQERLSYSNNQPVKFRYVSDYYNLIHRHNINNYFLCKVESFGDKNLTEDEINSFHLSTLKLSYEEAVKEYKDRANTKIGKLVANRELPVLYRAKEILQGENSVNNRK